MSLREGEAAHVPARPADRGAFPGWTDDQDAFVGGVWPIVKAVRYPLDEGGFTDLVALRGPGPGGSPAWFRAGWLVSWPPPCTCARAVYLHAGCRCGALALERAVRTARGVGPGVAPPW